jgi:hypothetical protein
MISSFYPIKKRRGVVLARALAHLRRWSKPILNIFDQNTPARENGNHPIGRTPKQD